MLFKRILCLLFTALILFADSGQTIYAHTCLKTGHVSITLLKHTNIPAQRTCCKATGAVQSSNQHAKVTGQGCCVVSSKLLKHAVPSAGINWTKASLVKAISVLLPLNLHFSFNQTPLRVVGSVPQVPPLISAASAVFTQVFRI